MAHYLFAVHHDMNAPKMSPEREQRAYAETGAFNRKMMDVGAFVYANGITGPEAAVLVDNTGEVPRITDEMYIPGSRYLGGFWILDIPDDETAKEWALEASRACNQPVEVRRFH